MSFADEMAEVAAELLNPAEFGEVLTITRKQTAGGTYDSTTRRRTGGTPLVQTLHGTFDSELTPASQAGNLASRHARVLYAVPAPVSGTQFEPTKPDLVAGEGKQWQIEETAHVIKQGVPILWICGLSNA